MTLELVYDENVFEFDDYAQGQGALTTFNLMHTGDFTPPIRFNWVKQNSDIGNDFSTGNLLTFYSTLKPDCQGGNYEIGLKNKGTEYLKNNNPTLKSAIIDKAVVNVAENKITGGYEYNSEESLNMQTDFQNAPSRVDDEMFSYEFSGWEGAVWRGEVPNDSSVIYYVARYTYIPKVYDVW